MKWTHIQLIKSIISYTLICDMLKKPGSVSLNTTEIGTNEFKHRVQPWLKKVLPIKNFTYSTLRNNDLGNDLTFRLVYQVAQKPTAIETCSRSYFNNKT